MPDGVSMFCRNFLPDPLPEGSERFLAHASVTGGGGGSRPGLGCWAVPAWRMLPLAAVLSLLGAQAHAQAPLQPSAARAPLVAALQPVVVTATAGERNLADVPASVSVVQGAALRERPVLDLADALRGTEGINIQSAGLGRRAVSIRGMDAAHTLFLVDGKRISASSSGISHSDYELGWVPTEAIERVEVVRGPLSSLYGSEALGGVVNVITRTATDEWQGSLSSYYVKPAHDTGGAQFKTGLYAGGPLVKDVLGLSVWGEYLRRNALEDGSNPGLSLLDRNVARSGNAALSWTPDGRQRIDVTAGAGNEERDGVRGTTAASYESDDTVRRRHYSAAYRGDWSWGSSDVKLYRSTLYRENWRSDGGTATGPNRFVDTVADASLKLVPWAGHTLTLGGTARREKLEDPTVNRAGRLSMQHYAALLQDEWRLNRQWELVLGGRLDWHEEFGREASPRAYVLYHFNDALTFKGGIGKGFKAPTLKQLSPEYESRAAMGGRGIIRGNPDLLPETAVSFEAGLDYDGGGWNANAMVFQNDVKNLIETQRAASCDIKGLTCLYYQNVAKARIRGLELGGGVDLPWQMRLDANYMWLDPKNRETGETLADRPRHSGGATLAWSPLPAWTARLRAEIVGRQYNSGSTPRTERPGYALLSLYADYAINRYLTLQAGVENLGDRRLAAEDVTSYSLADEGRRYYLGMNARF